MIKSQNRYDLEERTYNLACLTRSFIREIPRTITNIEDVKQLTRSSGSIGANYIEANEALSKKDFNLRIKICRKEAKETIYWLRLIYLNPDIKLKEQRNKLIKETIELMKIFGAIIEKSK